MMEINAEVTRNKAMGLEAAAGSIALLAEVARRHRNHAFTGIDPSIDLSVATNTLITLEFARSTLEHAAGKHYQAAQHPELLPLVWKTHGIN